MCHLIPCSCCGTGNEKGLAFCTSLSILCARNANPRIQSAAGVVPVVNPGLYGRSFWCWCGVHWSVSLNSVLIYSLQLYLWVCKLVHSLHLHIVSLCFCFGAVVAKWCLLHLWQPLWYGSSDLVHCFTLLIAFNFLVAKNQRLWFKGSSDRY